MKVKKGHLIIIFHIMEDDNYMPFFHFYFLNKDISFAM